MSQDVLVVSESEKEGWEGRGKGKTWPRVREGGKKVKK